MKLEPSLYIFEKTQISNFMKIRPVSGESFHAERGTGGHKERHDEDNSHFSPHYCESSSKLATISKKVRHRLRGWGKKSSSTNLRHRGVWRIEHISSG
jgi:hypothetical protein